MRQRVAAALDSSVGAGRSKKSGNPVSVAASCKRWLVLRSSLSIAPMTAAGAAECSASSIAHNVSLRLCGLDQDQPAWIEPKRVEDHDREAGRESGGHRLA